MTEPLSPAKKAVRYAHYLVQDHQTQLAEFVDLRADTLRFAHDDGATWAELGELMGVSAQRAQMASVPRDLRVARQREAMTRWRQGREAS